MSTWICWWVLTTWDAFRAGAGGGNNDVQWCFSQVKGAIDDDVAEGKFRVIHWTAAKLHFLAGISCMLVVKLA